MRKVGTASTPCDTAGVAISMVLTANTASFSSLGTGQLDFTVPLCCDFGDFLGHIMLLIFQGNLENAEFKNCIYIYIHTYYCSMNVIFEYVYIYIYIYHYTYIYTYYCIIYIYTYGIF